MGGRVVSRSVRVPEDLDVTLKVLASRARMDKSDLYRAGAALVLAIAKQGKAPAELLATARIYDPETPSIISKLVTRNVVVEPARGDP